MNITELFIESGSSKYRLRYDLAYQFICKHLKPKPRILEIGILHGKSIELWRKCFGKDAYIAALDINPKCIEKAKSANKVYVGGQTDVTLLHKIVAEADGYFDLIIDDASHVPQDQLITFQTLWPKINDWGVYAIEDCGSNVGKFRARAGDKTVVELLYEKSIGNMMRHARKPPEEYICFCGQAIFIVKVPK